MNQWTTVMFRPSNPDSLAERDSAFTLETQSGANQTYLTSFSRVEAKKLLADLKNLLEVSR